MLSVAMVSTCQASEVALDSEIEEVALTSACPCSKSCRCDETCSCRITGCRGCCDQYKDKSKGDDADLCVAAYCDCEETKCGCGCATPADKSCCS